MKKKFLKFIVVMLLLVQNGLSQKYHQTDVGVEIRTDSFQLQVQFYSPTIVRILKLPIGIDYEKKSLSVVKVPEKVALKINQQDEVLSVSSKSVLVKINVRTGDIDFFTASGAPLLNEMVRGTQFTPKKDGEESTYSVQQSFLLKDDEAIYGLGQHQKGLMSQRNQQLELRQTNMEIAVPFFQSVKGYGVFWDNYSASVFKDVAGSTSFESEVGNCVDYYFIYGGNSDKVIAGYRVLTGQAPMFPRWAFGYWQSRERYQSQEEPVQVVAKYRELKVPLDGIVQDWRYWGEDEDDWNSTEFGNPRFPDPKRMIDSIHDLKAHMMISVWPSFGNKTKIFQEFKKRNMLLNFRTWPDNPNVQLYDPFNPEARDIYWKYLNQNLFALGIDGWWLDSTEPDQSNPKEGDADDTTYLGTFRKMRNAFPLVHTGGVYQHQRQTSSQKRVFILARSAFAGQQRYGTVIWSGDVHSGWDVLRHQISGGLNLSLSGIPYWNSDIGGFFSRANYPGGANSPAFQELYVRWLEFSTFCPMMRSHGTDTPREIYQFGKKGDWAYDAINKFLNMRYRMLPYNYSNAWEITSKSGTMMRALVMDFPHDKNVRNINNEYLFGKSLLVCPVTDSMYTRRVNGGGVANFSKTKVQEVYLPAGTDWFDFWTGEKIAGSQQVEKNAPIDEIPLYVKAGSILPLGPFQQYCGEKDASVLEVRIYEGADGVFTLYEDENDNYDYEKGVFSTITMKWNNKERKLTIEDRKGTFPKMLQNRTFNLILVGKNNGTGMDIPTKFDKNIRYSGKAVMVKW